MVKWSNALPLTASCLSSLLGFESPRPTEASGKVLSDLGLDIGFHRILRPVSSTTYNWLFTIPIKPRFIELPYLAQ